MPQLDATFYNAQIFWLAVSFVLLWFLMQWFVVPRMRCVLEGRKRRLADLSRRIDDLGHQTDSLRRSDEERIRHAQHQAQERILAVVQEIKELKERERKMREVHLQDALRNIQSRLNPLFEESKELSKRSVDTLALLARDRVIKPCNLNGKVFSQGIYS